MTQYLVAADADQIQTFLFRSAHLREVRGGSMLLADFCAEEKKIWNGSVIISAGGSFRLEFREPGKAEAYLADLAERFRTRTGETLTVAGPEAYEEGGFQAANRRLQEKLLGAKLDRPGFEAVAHLPVVAFCASCGVELATTYASPTPELPPDQQRETYLCDTCRSKAEFRHVEQNSFDDKFRPALRAETASRNVSGQSAVFSKKFWEFPTDPADSLGELDPTQYVAYLVGDGNGMGRLFDQQSSRQELTDLSERLEKAMWASLAAPVPDLIQRLEELEKYKGWCPVIPLIVGGDDLFALVPARYALDTAQRVCEAFEKEMGAEASLGVAIVICQRHYPYMLAHERGVGLLHSTKRLGKTLGGASAVTFDVIVGNELVQTGENQQPYRATLKPYLAGRQAKAHPLAGLPLGALLGQRLDLNRLPGKRKAELRALFNLVSGLDLKNENERKPWEQKLETIRQRLGDETGQALDQALAALGGEAKPFGRELWRAVTRPYEKGKYWAHGLPDLIEAWEYAYRLDLPAQVYWTKEEEWLLN